jgi:hypothetical protein
VHNHITTEANPIVWKITNDLDFLLVFGTFVDIKLIEVDYFKFDAYTNIENDKLFGPNGTEIFRGPRQHYWTFCCLLRINGYYFVVQKTLIPNV